MENGVAPFPSPVEVSADAGPDRYRIGSGLALIQSSGSCQCGGKTITAFRDGNDVFVVPRTLAQNLAQSGNIPCQAAFLYKCVLPDSSEQVFFIDDPPATLNQRQKRVINLGREGDDFASFEEKALIPVKPIRSKLQALSLAGAPYRFQDFIRISSESAKDIRSGYAVLLRCWRIQQSAISGDLHDQCETVFRDFGRG